MLFTCITCNCSLCNINFVGFQRLTLSQTCPGFYVSAVQVIWKHSGKKRNCSSRAILPFSTVFSTHLTNFLPFSSNLKLSSAKSFSLEESKICPLGKGWKTNELKLPVNSLQMSILVGVENGLGPWCTNHSPGVVLPSVPLNKEKSGKQD